VPVPVLSLELVQGFGRPRMTVNAPVRTMFTVVENRADQVEVLMFFVRGL